MNVIIIIKSFMNWNWSWSWIRSWIWAEISCSPAFIRYLFYLIVFVFLSFKSFLMVKEPTNEKPTERPHNDWNMKINFNFLIIITRSIKRVLSLLGAGKWGWLHNQISKWDTHSKEGSNVSNADRCGSDYAEWDRKRRISHSIRSIATSFCNYVNRSKWETELWLGQPKTNKPKPHTSFGIRLGGGEYIHVCNTA